MSSQKPILDADSKNTMNDENGGERDRDGGIEQDPNTKIDLKGGSDTSYMNVMPELRQRARQEYLMTRPDRQLALARRELEEQQSMFEETELTGRERKRLKTQEQIVELASKVNMKAEETHFYTLPDAVAEFSKQKDEAKNLQILSQRYRDSEKAVTHTTTWEQEQIGPGYIRVDNVKQMDGKQYDLVGDDPIDFITEQILEGKDPLAEFLAMKAQAKEAMDPSKQAERAKEAAKTQFEAIQASRKKLPVYPYRDELIEAVRNHQVLIIVGETGSGKTTQVLQYLLEEGFAGEGKMLGCTQPRRVAAMSVAARVAQERGCKLGKEVGYSVRFDECSSESTKLKYMTDGMLLREFLSSPELDKYSVMMIDEAHERTLFTDILFGLVKDIAKARPNLKLLISSATLDAKKFSDYFDGAAIFKIPGRMYPVNVYYTKDTESDYVAAAITAVMQIHVSQPEGDILVFFPGQDDIEAAEEGIKQRMKGLGHLVGTQVMNLLVLPIYAALPAEQQARIFEKTPPNTRKVVLATNIAETSLTIDGITFVVDSGFCKQKAYNPQTGLETLQVVPVSKASAEQRKGRAGRVVSLNLYNYFPFVCFIVLQSQSLYSLPLLSSCFTFFNLSVRQAPGKCFRLFTARAFKEELEENTVPEIQRTNLCNVVLLLKSLGINDLNNFDFLDPPPAMTLIRSLEMLYALGALNAQGNLTRIGRRMADLPLDPMLSKALLKSEDFGCVKEVLTVCAMLSTDGAIFVRPKTQQVAADTAHKLFRDPTGDHMTLYNVYSQWEENGFDRTFCEVSFIQHRSMQKAQSIRNQLRDMCTRVDLDENATTTNESKNEEANSIEKQLDRAGALDVRVRKAMTSGFFANTAKLERDGTYRTTKRKLTVQIHPSSTLYPKPNSETSIKLPSCVMYHELVKTSKEYMRNVSIIDPDWLTTIAPHYFTKSIADNATNGKSANPKGKYKKAG